MRVAVLTGGGDCAGQNAVLLGIAQKAELSDEIIYISQGWKGLIDYRTVQVTRLSLEDAISRCGTLTRTSRTNPYPKEPGDPASVEQVIETILKNNIEAIIVHGGEDTLGVIARLYQEETGPGRRLQGIRLIGVSKTMDGDLQVYSTGLQTAVEKTAEVIRDLRTTLASNGKVGIVEVFGRDTGHTAYGSGRAAGAEIILIPELGFSMKELAAHVQSALSDKKKENPMDYSLLIVIAEGAVADEVGHPIENTGRYTLDGQLACRASKKDAFGHGKLGGIGAYVADQLEELAHISATYITYTYPMRTGTSCAYDINFGLRAGKAAMALLKHSSSNGVCVVDCNSRVSADGIAAVDCNKVIVGVMPLGKVIQQRRVDLRDILLDTPEIYFGRDPGEIHDRLITNSRYE